VPLIAGTALAASLLVTRTLLCLLLVAVACAPALNRMTVPNPARSTNSIQATQSYEVPPYREDHRYEVTLARWTPSALGFDIHLVNADRCGLASSYAFALVDDRGRRYDFRPSGAARESAARGHLGASLHDVHLSGDFPAAIGADTRYVVLEVRPITDRGCTALDFRWDFAS
jgi:hypothetical protein